MATNCFCYLKLSKFNLLHICLDGLRDCWINWEYSQLNLAISKQRRLCQMLRYIQIYFPKIWFLFYTAQLKGYEEILNICCSHNKLHLLYPKNMENTPTGASTNPKNFDLNNNWKSKLHFHVGNTAQLSSEGFWTFSFPGTSVLGVGLFQNMFITS